MSFKSKEIKFHLTSSLSGAEKNCGLQKSNHKRPLVTGTRLNAGEPLISTTWQGKLISGPLIDCQLVSLSPVTVDSELLMLPRWGAKLTCWKRVTLIGLPFPQQRKQGVCQAWPRPRRGTEPYPTFNDPEMESPFFLTMVTNSKGPTSFLIMVTAGSITIWGQIRIWSEAEKFHPLGANPSNFPILNRTSFRKGPFSFYSLPEYYL